MKTILHSEKYFTYLGYALGAVGGYLYYLAFPCTTGCALRSTPYATIFMGLLLGGIIFQFLYEFINPKNKKDVKNNH